MIRSALGVVILLALQMAGQSPYPQFPSTNNGRNGQNFPDATSPMDREANSHEKRRIQLLNAERQKAIVSDTEKLLKLAKELNDTVAQSEPGTRSAEQLRKVEEIGKLARSVKEKMSYSVSGFSGVPAPLTAQPGIE